MAELFYENLFEDQIDSKVKSILANDFKQPGTYTAEVLRKDSEGRWWVRFIGSDDETPIMVNKIDMRVGDIVTVTVKDHQSIADGNLTSPALSAANTYGYVDRVIADVIKASEAEIGYLKADVATIGYAQIQDADITNARIQNLVYEVTTNTNHLTAVDADILDLRTNSLTANSAVITNLQAQTAKVQNLTAEELEASVAYIDDLSAGNVTAADIIADHAEVSDLDANYAHITDGVIDNAKIGHADVNGLTANYAHVSNGVIDNASIGHANVNGLNANYAHVSNGVIDNAKIGHADVNGLSANYAEIDMANVNNAWIQNGAVKNAAITNEMVQSVSANKLTAGTIDASVINVTNLQADNIKVSKINGQTVTGKSIADALEQHESDITDLDDKIDTQVEALNDRIDGAIESHTGTAVPTLQNSPASSWSTTALKDEHVGDVYYVVNDQIPQNGYCYRFTKSGSTYSWQLIKDSDVTAALSRLQTAEGKIGDIEAFDVTMSTFKTNTEGAISTLQTKTSTLETSLGDKVDTTTFNELSQTVDGNSSTITTLGTVLTNNGLTTSTNISNTVNSVQQTANANSASITSLATTVQENYDKAVSRGEQLVTNGSGMLGDNTNFSSWTYDPSVSMNGSAGSFTIAKEKVARTPITDEYISVTATEQYLLSYDIMSETTDAERPVFYSYVVMYDIDKNGIDYDKVHYVPGTMTTLARELKAGDTEVYLANVDDSFVYANNQNGLSFWNYTNSKGYTYPVGTYTRNVHRPLIASQSQIDKANNKINLSSAWTGPTYSAGTPVSMSQSGATYVYVAATNIRVPAEPTHMEGTLGPGFQEGNKSESAPLKFREGVAYARIGFLWNYQAKSNAQIWIANLNFRIYNASQGDLDSFKTTTTNKFNTVDQTLEGIETSIGNIEETVATKADGSTVTTLTSQVNTMSDTVEGHTQSISSITSEQTSIKQNAVKSTVQLWFTKSNTTAPNKPTAHVTTNNAATGNAWNLAVPTYNSSYPNYYYCYEYEYVNGTYGWSAVTRDIATGESQATARSAASDASTAKSDAATAKADASSAVSTANTANTNASNAVSTANTANTNASNAVSTANTANSNASSAVSTANTASSTANTAKSTADTAKATADKNIRTSQQLWFTKANSTAPGKPSSKVTSTATTGNAWTTKVPVYSESYPHYFYCMQYIAADGTVTWSDVVYDQATTEAQSVARTASANYTSLQTDYADFKQTVNEFNSTIGTTYATKTELSEASSGAEITKSVSGERVIVTEDAADLPLIDLTAYGESVQDGTPTPSAPVYIRAVRGRNLLTKSLVDSSNWTHSIANTTEMTGTADNLRWEMVRTGGFEHCYIEVKVVAGTTYTLSVEYQILKAFELWNSSRDFGLHVDNAQPSSGDDYGIRITSILMGHDIMDEPRYGQCTFTPTTSSVWINIPGGYVKDGSTNVPVLFSKLQLEVGSFAHDYIPYGYVSVKSIGKNNLYLPSWNEISSYPKTGNYYNYPIYLEPNTTYYLSTTYDAGGNPKNGGYLLVSQNTGNGYWKGIGHASSGKNDGTLTTDANGVLYLNFNGTQEQYEYFLQHATSQLERGIEATDYEPYEEHVSYLDLKGQELHGLNETYRDILTIDADRHAVIEKRTLKIYGSELSAADYGTNPKADNTLGLYCNPTDPNLMAKVWLGGKTEGNPLPIATFLDGSTNVSSWYGGAAALNTIAGTASTYPHHMFACVSTSDYADAAAFNTALHGPLANEYVITGLDRQYWYTIDLGYVDLPQVTDGGTVYVASEVQPVIDGSWWTKAGYSVGKLSQQTKISQGSLEAPYTEVEWVESDGTQYVYLDWKPPIATWGFEADFIIRNTFNTTQAAWRADTNSSNAGFLFGTRNTSGVNDTEFGAYSATGFLRIGDSPNQLVSGDMVTDRTSRQTVKLIGNTFTRAAGTTKTLTRVSETADKPYANMTVFAYHDGLRRSGTGNLLYPSTSRVYSLKFYDGDELKVDLVGAVRNRDRMTGLYDKVKGHFYPAKGLLCGNEIGVLGEPDTISKALGKQNISVSIDNRLISRMWEAEVPTLDRLDDGQQITVVFSTGVGGSTPNAIVAAGYDDFTGWDEGAGTSYTSVYLKLTLSDGSNTGWIPCYYGQGTRLTSHYGSGMPVLMTYRENVLYNATTTSAGTPVMRAWYADPNYVDGNTTYTKYSDAVIAGKNGLKPYTLCMKDDAGNWTTVVNQAATGLNDKTCYTGGLQLGAVTYHITNGTYAAGANGGQLWESYGGIDFRRSANGITDNVSTTTLQLRKPVYFVGTLDDDDGLFYLDTTKWWTQDSFTTGKVYVLVGHAYTSNNAIFLAAHNPSYIWNGTKLVEFAYSRIVQAETKIVQTDSSILSLAQANTTWTAPDGTTQTNQTAAKLQLKANKDTLTSEINASADTVKISADRVNIEGAAIFTSGRLSSTSLNNAYDAKGAAATAKSEAISAAASDATSKANTAKSEAISAAASDATSKANTAKSDAIASAKNYVDTMEIGGRNLLLGTPRSYDSSSYDAYTLAFNDPLEIGQKYTVQLWDVDVSHTGKTAEQLGIFVYIGGGTAHTGANWQGTSYFTNGHADRLARTFTYTQSMHDASGGTNKWLVLYNSVSAANGTKTMSIGKWKLEKGSKATDWTPAPEDQTAYVDDSVNNIEIGGRNLLYNSKDLTPLWTNPNATIADGVATLTKPSRGECRIYQMPVDNAMEKWLSGKTYTMSVDAKRGTGSANLILVPRGASSKIFTLTSDWARYSLTVTCSGDNTASASFELSGGSTGDTILLRYPKVEYGNKATDWTPAPEDLASASDSVEYIVGTQAAATGSWTGVTKETSLAAGKTIAYKLPYAGNGNASLQLKDSSGNNVGGNNPVFSMTTRVTTHYPAGSIIQMTFDGTNWRTAGWYNTNNVDRKQIANAVRVAENYSAYVIGGYSGSGYKKIAANLEIDLSHPVAYLNQGNASNQTYAVASGGTSTNFYTAIPSVNVRTTNGVSNWTGTQYAPLYLKGTMNGNTFKVHSDMFTTTVPSSADGCVYMYVGLMYSTYQVNFDSRADLYAFLDGKFRQVTPTEIVVSQRIYWRTDAVGIPSAPSSWVDEDDNVYKSWTTKVPPMAESIDADASYPYLYTCEQRKRLDGTVNCTQVLLDENTTIIDGGSIITNSIAANKLDIADVITVGGIARQDDFDGLDRYVRGEYYVLTEDATVQEGKVYYNQVVDGDSVEYTVSSATVGSSASGLYELENVTSRLEGLGIKYDTVNDKYEDVSGICDDLDSVLNDSENGVVAKLGQVSGEVDTLSGNLTQLDEDVKSVLTIASDSITIGKITNGAYSGCRAVLTSNSVDFVNSNGEVVSSYGEKSQIGRLSETHIEASGDYLLFMPKGMSAQKYDMSIPAERDAVLQNAVAYIAIDSQDKSVFYMNRSVVVDDMHLGENKWKFFKRENNNLSLKWMGGM